MITSPWHCWAMVGALRPGGAKLVIALEGALDLWPLPYFLTDSRRGLHEIVLAMKTMFDTSGELETNVTNLNDLISF